VPFHSQLVACRPADHIICLKVNEVDTDQHCIGIVVVTVENVVTASGTHIAATIFVKPWLYYIPRC
jgi:hypothetical protein